MGYFVNGLVFSTEPDFSAIASLNRDRFARGYKHKEHAVWLMDFWKPKGTVQRRTYPFCDPMVGELAQKLFERNNESFKEIVTIYEELAAISEGLDQEIRGYLNLAMSASTVHDGSVFCFAADDEDLDFACTAHQGILNSFGFRQDFIAATYSNDAFTVTPINQFMDGCESEFEAQLKQLSAIRGIEISETRDDLDGQQLFENPVALWPAEAGSAEEMLRLGTWEPLENLEADYEIVFEKLSV